MIVSVSSKGRRTLEDYLVKHGPLIGSHYLKKRLFAAGLKKRECEECGQTEEWRGKTLYLILDHINGDHYDNRLENLRILCPNCNACLPTHGSKNRSEMGKEKICRRCQKLGRWPGKPVHCPSCRGKLGGKSKIVAPTFCAYCGQEYKLPGLFCSDACASTSRAEKTRRTKRPPYEALKADIEKRGYLQVGATHGVSDNAIRKWIHSYQEELGISEKVAFKKAESSTSPIPETDLRRMTEAGMTLDEIAVITGLHKWTVRRWCIRLSIETEGMRATRELGPAGSAAVSNTRQSAARASKQASSKPGKGL